MEVSLQYWLWFSLMVLVLLVLDLTVFHRKAHRVSTREAVFWTIFWVGLALAFNVWVWVRFGDRKAAEFLTGYLIEEALSVDNIFVFVIIFRTFQVKPEYQHRILFWGIIGAVLMRLIFILAGTELIDRVHGVIYVFGAFLLYTGFKLLFHKDAEVDPNRNWALRLFRRYIPTTTEFEGPKFLVNRNGRWVATPLLLVLVVVETTDLMFAVDSVPAILAITTDRFIVFTSNIFAILGLRSVYFVLAGMMEAFRFLKAGLSLVLIFVGVKMLTEDLLEIPIAASLGTVAGILATAAILSRVLPRVPPLLPPEEEGAGPARPEEG